MCNSAPDGTFVLQSVGGCCADPAQQPSEDALPATRCAEEPEMSPCAVLASSVPALLEAMNRAAAEVNQLERDSTESVRRHQQRVSLWSSMHKELHVTHSVRDLDRARRYIEAEQALKVAAERTEAALRRFAGAQESDASREPSEREYAEGLAEYAKARAVVAELRSKVGEESLRRIVPRLRLLRKRSRQLAREQERIAESAARTKASKAAYGDTMRELERISTEIHAQRQRERAQRALGQVATVEGTKTSHTAFADEGSASDTEWYSSTEADTEAPSSAEGSLRSFPSFEDS